MIRGENKKKLLVIFSVSLVIGVGIGLVLSLSSQSVTPTHIPKTENISQRTMLIGEVVCLPHKDTSGMQTMECAYGIKTDDNMYYVLDNGFMSSAPIEYTTGDRIQARGIITPIERLSTDKWMKYNVQGIFSVTDSFEKVK